MHIAWLIRRNADVYMGFLAVVPRVQFPLTAIRCLEALAFWPCSRRGRPNTDDSHFGAARVDHIDRSRLSEEATLVGDLRSDGRYLEICATSRPKGAAGTGGGHRLMVLVRLL